MLINPACELCQQHVFFLVTSGRAEMKVDEVCAVESTSRLNPSMLMVVVFVLPARHLRLEENAALAELLRRRRNVRLATVDASAAMSGAGLDHLVKEIDAGVNAVVHTSEVLRVLLVLNFGGVYADLDIIMLRSLHQSVALSENFVVGDDLVYFASCFFGFQRNHTLAKR